jgi:hypothetical protein
MIHRIYDIVIYGIHAISVVPLLPGLARTIVAQVSSYVDFVVDLIVMASPIADLHLIVGAERCRVEYVDVAYFVRCTSVSLP